MGNALYSIILVLTVGAKTLRLALSQNWSRQSCRLLTQPCLQLLIVKFRPKCSSMNSETCTSLHAEVLRVHYKDQTDHRKHLGKVIFQLKMCRFIPYKFSGLQSTCYYCRLGEQNGTEPQNLTRTNTHGNISYFSLSYTYFQESSQT